MTLSFGRRNKQPPEDPCKLKTLRIFLQSQQYTPNPAVSFLNTQYCLPLQGHWRTPSNQPKGNPWMVLPNYLKMVRIEVQALGVNGCINLGQWWYNGPVQMSPSGRCYVDIKIYEKYTNKITINGLSDCYLPGLPLIFDPNTGVQRKRRAHYVPTRSNIKVWGGTASSYTVRMKVHDLSFSPIYNLTKC